MIKRGSKVRVVKMDTAGGMDWQAKRLEGKVFTVRFIDSAVQRKRGGEPGCYFGGITLRSGRRGFAVYRDGKVVAQYTAMGRRL